MDKRLPRIRAKLKKFKHLIFSRPLRHLIKPIIPSTLTADFLTLQVLPHYYCHSGILGTSKALTSF